MVTGLVEGEPIYDQIVEAFDVSQKSGILSMTERRLWGVALGALKVLFAPATESEEAGEKAWEETPDGLAHAIASAVIEHQRLIEEALMDTERGGVWVAVHEQRGRITELAERYREAVEE